MKDPIAKTTTYTYDVLYDDGDKDRGLTESKIKLKEKASATPEKKKEGSFKVGQRVKARFRGRPRSILKSKRPFLMICFFLVN